ncbi:hypothetical protein E2C01_085995 [Portunus trituberculatus]|uniref:G-protein coupled receptors family 1 profile domain-containing protein n=1 Tax=Portunus trituberculatus TaxID=210409 RepID=A0A5B7JC93_PORTR|nr:hypothetical protein [Portunus trituberculatus]
MYQFVNQLSYTASVIILVVVSGERYLAIVEPLRAKSLLTRRNMILLLPRDRLQGPGRSVK